MNHPDFAAENPEISVQRQIMPWGTFFDKLAAALVAGSGGPDVFVLWHSVMPQFARAGHLYPATQDLFELGMVPEEDYLPQLIEAITVDGTKWTMPLDNYGVGVYLNLDLLEQADVDPDSPPQDQTEWLDVCRALTWNKNGNHPGDSGFDPDNIEVWGYSIGWPRATIQPSLYQWGADIISRENPPEVLINSEGAIAATQFFVDLVYEHQVAPPPAGYDQSEAFANSQLAMFANGSWMYNWFPTSAPEIRHGFWPYPRLGPERGSTIMWSHTFAVAKDVDAEKRDAALRLLQYLSEHSDTWTEQAGMPAARLSRREGLMDTVWTLPTFDKQFKEEGVMEFASDRFTEIMGSVEPEWSAALNQDKTVDVALNDAAERIEKILS
ncbi:extracellular solute-binding protein [Chloroflexi bacterium TSY]|nr:extracellular solute-binding protein [Chloroflexi bacterium TSY]